MKNTSIEMVAEFHEAFCPGNTAPEPCVPGQVLSLLRLQLLTEEVAEFLEALLKNKRVEILRELTDLQYVLDGTCLACGIHSNQVSQMRVMPPEGPLMQVEALLYKLSSLASCMRHQELTGLVAALHDLQMIVDALFWSVKLSGVRWPAFEEVHRCNMQKLGQDGRPIISGSGRVEKPEGWRPPNLEQFFDENAYPIRDAQAGT